MDNAMAVAAAVAVAEAVPLPAVERVGLAAQLGLLAPLVLVLLRIDSVASLLDDAPSVLAFVFVFRDFDEWLLARGHTLGNGRLYIDDSDSEHIGNLHSEEPDIFGPYTRQCASTNASYPRNVVLLGTFHHRVDTWQHALRATNVAVDASTPVVDPILVGCHPIVHSAQEPGFVSELALVLAEVLLLEPALAYFGNASVLVVLEHGKLSPLADSLSGLSQPR